MIIKDKHDFEKKLRKLKKTFLFKIIRFLHYDFFIYLFPTIFLIAYLKNISKLTRLPYYFMGIIVIHWIFCNNECIIQYIFKKYMYKNYKLGDNPNLDIDDYDEKNLIGINSLFHINILLLVFFLIKDKTVFEYQTLIILLYFMICSSYVYNYYNLHFDYFGKPKKNKVRFQHPTIFDDIIYNTIVSKTVSKETKKLENRKN